MTEPFNRAQTAPPACSRAEILPLLKRVSRSFYLTVRVLPRAVRSPIGLAYLLARASDTIADTDVIGVAERLEALRQLRERIGGNNALSLNFSRFVEASADRSTASAGERALIAQIEQFVNCLDRVPIADQELIRRVLTIITSGQELDLQRFRDADASHIIPLPDQSALDDYTYRVAGCVGEFWSRLCRAHLFPGFSLDESLFLERGIRFGKGLQLVNVLRDVPADLRQGRCYLPENRLAKLGLSPLDLLQPGNYDRVRSFYNELIGLAEAHLQAGWQYTNMLPRGCVRLRLACAWPILIGLATLAKLRAGNVLDASSRIKVSRAQVRRLMLASVAGQILPGIWGRLPARAQMV